MENKFKKTVVVVVVGDAIVIIETLEPFHFNHKWFPKSTRMKFIRFLFFFLPRHNNNNLDFRFNDLFFFFFFFSRVHLRWLLKHGTIATKRQHDHRVSFFHELLLFTQSMEFGVDSPCDSLSVCRNFHSSSVVHFSSSSVRERILFRHRAIIWFQFNSTLLSSVLLTFAIHSILLS